MECGKRLCFLPTIPYTPRKIKDADKDNLKELELRVDASKEDKLYKKTIRVIAAEGAEAWVQ